MQETSATFPRKLPAQQAVEPVERFEQDRLRDELVEAEHLARYHWAANAVRDLDVLDLGCGTGYGCALLVETGGARRCLGVDIAQEAVNQATERYGHQDQLQFSVADAAALPFDDDSFDVVTCFETIEHLEEQQRAVAEARRVLRPGGMLLLSSPNRGEYPPGNPFHVRELTADELEQMLTGSFPHVRLLRQHNWLASAILDDQAFSSKGADSPLGVEVRKLQERLPGRELYTIAVCSDAPVELPPGSLLLLTHGLEVRRWLDQIEELSLTRKALADSERELLVLRDRHSIEMARLQRKAYWLERAQIDPDALMRRRAVRALARLLMFMLRIRRRLTR